MRRMVLSLVLVTAAACFQAPALAAPAAVAPAPAQPEGTWAGTLDAGAAKLRVQIHVTRRSDGTLAATFDSLDQGAMGIPFERTTQTPDGLRFESDKLHVVVEGRFSPDGATLNAEWRQGPARLPLTLTRALAPAALRRPQEPQPPFPYKAEDVAYTNPNDGTRLAGTLTLPEGKGPFGAVVLITGSGAQNRDEEIFGHKPFKLIADALTRRGVAVLRVDDRGVGGSGGDPRTATSLDFAGDVKAGVDFLRHRSEIDPKRVGLVGHSEGGMIAPVVAADDPRLAFIVLLAGPGVTGLEVTAHQTEDFARAQGKSEADVARFTALERRILAIAQSPVSAAEARPKLLPLLAQLGMSESDQAAQADALLSPWYRQFLRLDPATYMARVSCPVLALFGSKDTQVSAAVNQPAIARALEGHKDVTIRTLPHLNHLFQTAKTGMLDEYAQSEETMAPSALDVLADWVVKHAR